VPPATLPTSADRFARIIDGLCRAIAAQGAWGRLTGPLMLLVWSRLRRMAVRFASLAARVQAGTAAPRRPAAPRPAGGRRRPPYQRLPRGFAWLVRLVPQAASGASQLQHLLAEPEMATLLAAAPQMGRTLRPLCRMLGLRPPPGLLGPRPAPPAAPACAASPGHTPPAASSPGTARPSVPVPAPPFPVRACGPPIPA
jgi:hypothetical protein